MNVSPPCRAVLLTAKACGVDFSVNEINLLNGEQMAPEFVAINPAHCVPTMRDGELTIWESRAICQYLANKYASESNLYPSDPEKRAKIDMLLYWDMGTLYGKGVAELVYPQLFNKVEEDPEKVKQMNEKLQFLNDHLIKGEYLTGDTMTIADISIACSLTMPQVLYPDILGKFEKVKAFYEKVTQMDGWEKITEPFWAWRSSMKKE